VALTYPVLIGTDGTRRMSKSQGNYVGLFEPPSEQFGKTMSIPDEVMTQWSPLITDWAPSQVVGFANDLESGRLHPMEAKKQLAHRVVELYHGIEAAAAAQEDFERTFQRGGRPDAVPETVLRGPTSLVEVLIAIGAAASLSDARRLIRAGAVRLDDTRIDSTDHVVDRTHTIRVGPRRFYQVLL
jgi:tyrosyl-tRNA synthetase